MDTEDNQQIDMQDKEILSIAQDLVYKISGDKCWNLKHLGLANTFHPAQEVVPIFHNAGYTITYDKTIQIDTALAEKSS